jgi:hypothetical protein
MALRNLFLYAQAHQQVLRMHGLRQDFKFMALCARFLQQIRSRCLT